MKHRSLITLLACMLGCAVAVPAASGLGTNRKPIVKNARVIDNFYTPTKLTIKKGGQVKWTWDAGDFNTHTVSLVHGPKGVRKSKFSSAEQGAGSHFRLTFAKTGSYHFQCMIHPEMNMTVTVKN
jgi:plastocyanin